MVNTNSNINDLSEREMVKWLSDITSERIVIDRHPKKRSRKRCHTEEFLYEYLIERRFKKIEKKVRDGDIRFDLHYDNADKSKKENIIIVIMPLNIVERNIKVVTIIIE